MNFPGFTAEFSLRRQIGYYTSMAGIFGPAETTIVPQQIYKYCEEPAARASRFERRVPIDRETPAGRQGAWLQRPCLAPLRSSVPCILDSAY
jgi:hypothetical protein